MCTHSFVLKNITGVLAKKNKSVLSWPLSLSRWQLTLITFTFFRLLSLIITHSFYFSLSMCTSRFNEIFDCRVPEYVHAQFRFEKHHGGASQTNEIILQLITIVFRMTAYLDYLCILSTITFDFHAFARDKIRF